MIHIQLWEKLDEEVTEVDSRHSKLDSKDDKALSIFASPEVRKVQQENAKVINRVMKELDEILFP